MHFSVAAWHQPVTEGTATGRILRALCDGLLADGHTLDVWAWGEDEPVGDLPDWCTWRPVPKRAMWRMHLRAIARPRSEITRDGWRPRPGAVALADDPVSYAAVDGSPHSVAVFHYAAALDGRALGLRGAHHLQDLRHDRRVARRARLLLAYSDRVAHVFRQRPAAVPVAFPVPPEPLPHVDAPVALLLANWSWAPNRIALEWLLDAWPSVRDRVPDARLVLAGRGDPSVGALAGVRVIGAVEHSADVLADAAVLAFPCPPTSGPKIKVLEALAAGLPVVTTEAGVEGLAVPRDAVAVADRGGFADALVAALADPAGRAARAERARAAVAAAHAPLVAARRRVEVIRARWPELG